MPDAPKLTTVSIPARIADLGFTIRRPADFESPELPQQEPNFDKPEFLFPLHVSMPPYAAIVFSVAARPAYGDGTVEDWANYLSSLQEWKLLEMKPGKVGALDAIIADSINPSEAGPMHCRYAFFEDGQRFIVISTLAPEPIWGSAEGTLQAIIDSFTLETPKGQTVQLTRRSSATPSKQPRADEGEPTKPSDIALSDDAGSLDQQEPMNARLLESGAGFVPRIQEVNTRERYAVLGAGAIQSTFRVPLGWHVIDDGKRTLVFDAQGKIQVNLNLRQTGSDHAEFLEGVLGQMLSEQADVEHLTMELGGMKCLALRNYRVGAERLQQAFLVKDIEDPNLALVARVTADDDNMVRAVNLAEVVLANLSHLGR